MLNDLRRSFEFQINGKEDEIQLAHPGPELIWQQIDGKTYILILYQTVKV